jgi:TatD DNase family protein
MIIDSHAHLDMEDFGDDLSEVIERARDGGLSHIVTIGTNLESSKDAVSLGEKYPFIFSTVGLHPHESSTLTMEMLDHMSRLALQPCVVGWGEIGLDYYRNLSDKEEQTSAFKSQLGVAHDMGLPVVIHDRDAHDETLAILASMGKGESKGVIHCFSGDLELAERFMDLGYLISVPGTVTFKKAGKIKEVASKIPVENLLVETDCPFLAPVPKRGKRNEPFFVTYTIGEIARLRGMDFDEVAKITAENAIRLFHLPDRI